MSLTRLTLFVLDQIPVLDSQRAYRACGVAIWEGFVAEPLPCAAMRLLVDRALPLGTIIGPGDLVDEALKDMFAGADNPTNIFIVDRTPRVAR